MNFISELIKIFIYSVCACVSKNKKENPTCSLSTTKTAYRQVPKDSKTGLNLNEHNNSSKLFCSLYCVSLTGVVQMVSRAFLYQREILTDLYCNWPHR